jgi:amino acid transporter
MSIRHSATTPAQDADVDQQVAARRLRRLRRAHETSDEPRTGKHAEGGHDLGVAGGLAALSLDALSSVAYGPEAMVVALLAGGVAALKFTVPIALAITALLVLLVVSYSQVIAAHPDGGGAYAVSKANIGRWPSLLAAASLVVDYTLTVAVSLAAGAASLGSSFPWIAHHLLITCLIALVLLTTINMFGISESAKALMLPTAVFVVSTLAVIVVGLGRSKPVAIIGTPEHIKVTEALGIVLILKAFAAGCSALTGVEAIANGVPAFRVPRVRTAQRTMLALGTLLAVMLVGLSVLIHVHHVVPRGDVTLLAQVTAAAFGKGAAFYIANLSVALVLALAANTSFGGLPVLMSLLARDHRLPHMFYLRAEKPVYRHGIVALALAALVLLVIVDADTGKLIPLYAIGVFIGFTLSQFGLVRHWLKKRPRNWRARAILNGAGMTMTAIAVVVFLISKFTEGAWILVIAIPVLMAVFSHTETYYARVASELRLGLTPPRPRKRDSVVVVPTSTVNLLTAQALSAALSMGETVVALAVAGDEEEADKIKHDWDEWKSGVPIEVLLDPTRSLIRTVLRYIESHETAEVSITVLIPEILPNKRRHEILHNQRGRLLESVLKSRTDVVIATLPFHIHD